MRANDLHPAGTVLAHYTILECLGQGAMATVYKAYQPSLDRYVAIKLLRPDAARTDLTLRFQQEIVTLGKLSHPNILPILDSGVAYDSHYLVLHYASGGTLQDRLTHPLAIEQILQIAQEIASALAYAHVRQIVHRDIKPANILFERPLTSSGDFAEQRVYLADFGIAKLIDVRQGLTQINKRIGSPSYMAPEQVYGHPVDGRTDIYALGIMLFYMLTGSLPFKGKNDAEVMVKQITEELPALESLRPDIPAWVVQVVRQACAKDPAQRFSTAQELLEVLRTGQLPASLAPSISSKSKESLTVGAEPVSWAVLAKAPIEDRSIRIEAREGSDTSTGSIPAVAEKRASATASLPVSSPDSHSQALGGSGVRTGLRKKVLRLPRRFLVLGSVILGLLLLFGIWRLFLLP